jgi:hypothetical protein
MMEQESRIINWLLDGDVSIQYQTHRDILKSDRVTLKSLRDRIEQDGWGAKYLTFRKMDGYWGRGFYQPKWTCSHYTLLELKNLGISPENKEIKESLRLIFDQSKGNDGGIYPIGTLKKSDVCINGMLMNYASYFGVPELELKSIVDFILSQLMSDGGFNCQSNRKGAVHSSLHSTLSVLEGIVEYSLHGYKYRLPELQVAENQSREFILKHRLFKSDKTGDIIDKKMLLLSHPSRWRFDILRALDYFRASQTPYDPRMDDALLIIQSKKRNDGTWPLQGKHPGQVFFEMEKPGEPSRWNTLRTLRVLNHYHYS